MAPHIKKYNEVSINRKGRIYEKNIYRAIIFVKDTKPEYMPMESNFTKG